MTFFLKRSWTTIKTTVLHSVFRRVAPFPLCTSCIPTNFQSFSSKKKKKKLSITKKIFFAAEQWPKGSWTQNIGQSYERSIKPFQRWLCSTKVTFRDFCSAADPVCLSRIRIFSLPYPGSWIPDPTTKKGGEKSINHFLYL